MPVGIPLQQLPSQTFTITLGGQLFELTVKACAGIMAVSVVCNGVDIVDSVPAVAGGKIIPSQYLENGNGNFMFLTANQQLPNYEQFGLTQSLLYFTAAELQAFRAPPPVPVTAAFFNPIAPLPLRFAPVGYALAP